MQCSEVNFKEHNQSRNSRAMWLYSLMRIENRPTFCTKLFNAGVKSIGDLVDDIFFFTYNVLVRTVNDETILGTLNNICHQGWKKYWPSDSRWHF